MKTPLCSNGRPRRIFLSDCGMGLTGMVLGSMLGQNLKAETPDGKPHFPPKAKRVIWLFMLGGVSHVESFDPKPELNKYAGKSIGDTPYKDSLANPAVKDNAKSIMLDTRKLQLSLYPMQTGFKKYGQSGAEVSDWFPHIGSAVDDIAIVRSAWTTDNDHGAILQFHTGRHILDGFLPTIGSWAHYGLGSLNENLPSFVVLGEPPSDCCGGNGTHGSGYLGPEHSGVHLEVNPDHPLPFVSPGADVYRKEQQREFEFINKLNSIAAVEYPADAALKARIKSYELAYRMQMAVPEAIQFKEENEETKRLYGLDQENTKGFGEVCLAARRLSERGVRFVQIYHGGAGNAWDAHKALKKNHGELSAKVDKPIAGLLKDLKQRGMLDDTIVVWATEFGRTPGAEAGDGRDHHPYGFSIFMAGAGIKRGVVHGATDEIGFHAVTDRHYVTDVHATVLKLMGIDPRRLEVPGRKRLEIDYGKPIEGILS
ncbi:DUF1501 domain-containing protein [Bryobacter aggregatus]|uniref:DUF1501 domain-containing protein n=1 Tax=Bryobacter aggregatus TaxID=360054 RepID=UPI0004E1B601|nr:DUF1501 domain-containing protein [Bryobacter aggregatus]